MELGTNVCYFLATGDSSLPIHLFFTNDASEGTSEWSPMGLQAHTPSGPSADEDGYSCEGADEWGRDMNATISLGLLTNDIESRGVAQFADALEAARKKCSKMSDERLKAALFEFGGLSGRAAKHATAIQVQPSAPGRRRAASGGRAAHPAGRPRAEDPAPKKAKRRHDLNASVSANVPPARRR